VIQLCISYIFITYKLYSFGRTDKWITQIREKIPLFEAEADTLDA